ncbi:inositol 2-dehydrogenase [Enterovibrio norvegicus]|uniref:inositol 2-dehydrogenase n=1 Tax=Enterovibrio norvegicus TaxID=188144 RepID=UPI000308F7F9|nr:inositol 2-dehydrogenase [Enterovibrio norvegicus]MCC4797361.1 inositol 2-dehydrogenase [Enterovibrio norvegicus]OEE43593.1 inositol 2-dehydrogenase [Enterovibrio norvegicus]PMH66711.1 inositol 2-dehydrogenase [Enterovibrio norvegicus]PMI27080.1 inositol 2-dehydrogenase [Enterovibrio norvegicus]PMI40197.1 inositol 2-dehydrogenase [Enterovibrio norvegicus]
MFNIALFGCGRIGKVHAVNIAANPQTQIRAVIDPYQEGAMQLAEQYGADVMTVDEAMSDPDIHAVCICSATDTHADLIELAAKAGKAIFCEKPIDLSLARVKACLEVVDASGVPFLVGFNRRYDPQFRTLKDLFESGAIGKAETLVITSRDPSPPPVDYVKVSGGIFRDMSVHDLDMARFIMGEDPVSVSAHGSCLVDPKIGEAGDIDSAVIVLHFPSGAMANIINSRRSGYGYDQRIELHGSKGMLKAGNVREHLVEHWGEEDCSSAKPQYFFLERYEKAYIAEWQHFVDVLEGKVEPQCSGYDGEQALVLAEAALESLNAQNTVKLG